MKAISIARTLSGAVIILLTLTWETSASASLLLMPPPDTRTLLVALILILLVLATEALCVAALTSRHGFLFLRVVFVWLIIATLTWIAVLFLFFGVNDLARKANWAPHPELLLVGKALVIIVEAYILRWMSSLRVFRKDVGGLLPLRLALLYPLAASVISISAGAFIAWALYEPPRYHNF